MCYKAVLLNEKIKFEEDTTQYITRLFRFRNFCFWQATRINGMQHPPCIFTENFVIFKNVYHFSIDFKLHCLMEKNTMQALAIFQAIKQPKYKTLKTTAAAT